jgi:hypothetical protein
VQSGLDFFSVFFLSFNAKSAIIKMSIFIVEVRKLKQAYKIMKVKRANTISFRSISRIEQCNAYVTFLKNLSQCRIIATFFINNKKIKNKNNNKFNTLK